MVNDINASGTSLLFVGLGCPKQEVWMAEHREKLNCTMVGAGAVFDFIADMQQATCPEMAAAYGFGMDVQAHD
jgi:exopolysaccharide biosynthesis WecB/TagA/CpsF family protein